MVVLVPVIHSVRFRSRIDRTLETPKQIHARLRAVPGHSPSVSRDEFNQEVISASRMRPDREAAGEVQRDTTGKVGLVHWRRRTA
jgi:hypothetical protein